MLRAEQVAFSDELLTRLARLTNKQRAGLLRMVETRAAGLPMRRLFEGPDKICSLRTYYSKKSNGWSHQPEFKAALEMAERQYLRARMETSVAISAEMIRTAGPVSVELAETLVKNALYIALPALTEPNALGAPSVSAHGRVLAAGLKAGLSLLDRADLETAVKGLSGDSQKFEQLLWELRGIGEGDQGVENGAPA